MDIKTDKLKWAEIEPEDEQDLNEQPVVDVCKE